MESNEKQKKFLNGMSDALQKATELSKKAVDGLQKGAKTLSEKTQNNGYERRLKKYKPFFSKDLDAEDFRLPNIIQIVDEVVRKDVDVCEGAIGWTSVEKETEVLHLYEEETQRINVTFIPYMECNAIYYVDHFDNARYVKVDCIFSRSLDEKLAELKYIAHTLGAKQCTIEIEDKKAERKSVVWGIGGKLGRYSASDEQSASSGVGDRRRGRIEAKFEGNDNPKKPKLKWFAHDDNIKRLIEMRCTSRNSIKSETLELEGASSATMSLKMASAINSVMGNAGIKTSLNLEKKAEEEQQSKMIFSVEF